jgi:hypothetical protein
MEKRVEPWVIDESFSSSFFNDLLNSLEFKELSYTEKLGTKGKTQVSDNILLNWDAWDVRNCQNRVITLICIHKYRESNLDILPLEIIILIAKHIWSARF